MESLFLSLVALSLFILIDLVEQERLLTSVITTLEQKQQQQQKGEGGGCCTSNYNNHNGFQTALAHAYALRAKVYSEQHEQEPEPTKSRLAVDDAQNAIFIGSGDIGDKNKMTTRTTMMALSSFLTATTKTTVVTPATLSMAFRVWVDHGATAAATTTRTTRTTVVNNNNNNNIENKNDNNNNDDEDPTLFILKLWACVQPEYQTKLQKEQQEYQQQQQQQQQYV